MTNLKNLNLETKISEICEQSCMRDSRLCKFLLKLLDFAHKISPNNSKKKKMTTPLSFEHRVERTPRLLIMVNYRTSVDNRAIICLKLHLIGEDYWSGGSMGKDLASLHQVCPAWRAKIHFWSHLSMVLLQVNKLLLQTLDLHLEIWAVHGELIQNLPQAANVSLYRLAHGKFILVPEAAKNSNGYDGNSDELKC